MAPRTNGTKLNKMKIEVMVLIQLIFQLRDVIKDFTKSIEGGCVGGPWPIMVNNTFMLSSSYGMQDWSSLHQISMLQYASVNQYLL